MMMILTFSGWTQMHTQVIHTHLTQESDSPIRVFSIWQPNARRGRGGALWCYNYNLTLWASKQEWIFQSGDLHGYLWWGPGTPRHRHTHKHTHACTHTESHRQIHNTHWLPEYFTSQSQMPQLSHQYHCANVANCYAHWSIVYQYKYGSQYAAGGVSFVKICEIRIQTWQIFRKKTQLAEQRWNISCSSGVSSPPFSHLALQLFNKHFASEAPLSSLVYNRSTSSGVGSLLMLHATPTPAPVLGPISTWFITLKYHCTN